jgi:hypothetical protein
MQLEEVRVTLSNGDVHHRVAITNRSQVAFEKEAAVRRWPSDSDTLARTFQAWWELAKLSKILTCTFEDFESTLCVEVAPYVTETRVAEMVKSGVMPEFVADELRADGLVLGEEDQAVADPTQPAPQPEEQSI